MPENYRFKIKVEGKGYLLEHLKLDYIPKVGAEISVSKQTYSILQVEQVRGILYRLVVETKPKGVSSKLLRR